MSKITGLIQKWYHKHKRDLPWRNTSNPYFIWLSEIILQQTQVTQGLAYYYKFVEAYPTVNDLANSSEEEVLKNWQGLGYYSRARNLHYAARQVVGEFKRKFPTSYNEIIKLKGVGEYTAAAVSSFAFNEVKAVVDGNVFRVLSRIYTVSTPINSSAGKKEFFELAQLIIDPNNPATHNQAMMELGALVCKPVNPKCDACPVYEKCNAFRTKTIENYPVKEKKLKIKKRFLNYVIVTNGADILINKRRGKGIWQGLYDFPLIESSSEISTVTALDGVKLETVYLDQELKHILTHQHLFVKFWIADVNDMSVYPNYQKIAINDLEEYPLPQLIVRYIRQSEFFKR